MKTDYQILNKAVDKICKIHLKEKPMCDNCPLKLNAIWCLRFDRNTMDIIRKALVGEYDKKED